MADRDVKIALVYQAEQAHQHMKSALVELGGRIVYESTVGRFAHPDLDASGADVIVINLDPEVNEEFDALGDLLDDAHRKVVINDGEVSSRLEGWDLARWTRHLATKILDVKDVNPPRPEGSEAIPVKVRTAAVEHTSTAGTTSAAPAPAREPALDASFELHATDLANALSADTDTALSAQRSRLVTDEEPVKLEIERVEEPGEYTFDPSEFNLPGDDEPLAKLPSADTAAPQESDADLAASLADFGFLEISDEPVAKNEVEGLDDLLLRAGEQEQEMRKGSLGKPQVVAPKGAPAPAAKGAPAPAAKGAPAAPARPGAAPAPGARPGGAPAPSARPAPAEAKKTEPARGAPARAGEPVKQRSLADFESALSGLSLESIDDGDAAPAPGSPFAPKPAPEPEKPKVPAPSAQQRAAEKFDLSGLSLSPIEDADETPATPPPAVAKDVPKPEAAKPKPPSAQEKAAESFDLSKFSLEALDGDEAAAAPTTGRASFGASDEPAKAAAAPAPAPAHAAPPPPGEDDLGLSLEGFDFNFDENTEIRTDSIVRLGSESSLDELAADLDSELDALLKDDDDVTPAATEHPVRRVCVLGASIGGPEAVREFLSTMPADVPVLFLLAQHMGADFLELMTQQLAKATKLKVRVPSNGETLRHGEVAVVPLTERIQVDRRGAVEITMTDEISPYTPSIDRVLVDVADQFGADAMAIVFSGMAHDAIDGTKHMHAMGGTIWVQDPSTCVISSMIDGAREAGVVTFTGSPAQLAKQFVQDYGKRA